MNKLDEICAVKRSEVARAKTSISQSELITQAKTQTPPRGFENALRRKAEKGWALIAEIKRASPSKGIIRADFDPAIHASDYDAGGASCLSVLTDRQFFHGHPHHLQVARQSCSLPVLRKDFIVDPWQVYEARAMGADAILLIAAALDNECMIELEAIAIDCGMDVLVEVHSLQELERTSQLTTNLVGINNRNLQTFKTDLGISEQIAPFASSENILVSESGILSSDDCSRLSQVGIRCFLVGETLMRAENQKLAIERLIEPNKLLSNELNV